MAQNDSPPAKRVFQLRTVCHIVGGGLPDAPSPQAYSQRTKRAADRGALLHTETYFSL